jgi:hypothetical protein
MPAPTTNTTFEPQGREAWLRAAVLQCFCDPHPATCARICEISEAQWRRLLPWLDTSGLALYFLDRMRELKLCHRLPLAIVARLEQNLSDNTERIHDLISESRAIQEEFQYVDLSYAVLKGFSLWPHSTPAPELRSQLDQDFLIAENHAPEARRILEQRGYRLHAVSGWSWEFMTVHPPASGLADLYKPLPLRSVELHLERCDSGRASLLARTERQDFHGISMPVLSPADLLFGQGMHLFKHVCGESFRAAHLLEFRRHVIARHSDIEFWREVRSIAAESPRACWGLGAVTLLISRAMDDFAPEALRSWTVAALPAAVRLWVESYGCRLVLSGSQGSKLYLFLQREFEAAGSAVKRPLWRVLLPFKLPPAIEFAPENESLPARLRRLRRQIRFIFVRLRFHAVEGLRYVLESVRWHRRLKERLRQNAFSSDVSAVAPRGESTAFSCTKQRNDNSLTST